MGKRIIYECDACGKQVKDESELTSVVMVVRAFDRGLNIDYPNIEKSICNACLIDIGITPAEARKSLSDNFMSIFKKFIKINLKTI